MTCGLLARRYGVAGQEALSRIGQATPELAERVARAREDAAGSAAPRTRELVLDELRGMLAVLPEGEVLPDELLQSASDHDLENFLQGCRRDTPGGAPAASPWWPTSFLWSRGRRGSWST